jgi:nucleoid-associated protein YgaU
MRKLVLFSLLGGVFGLALLLERFVTRPAVKVDADSDQLSLVIGGGTPRELPEIPDAPPPDAGGGGKKSDPRPAGRPAGGGPRGGSEVVAKERPPSPPSSPKPEAHDADAPRADHVVVKGETLMSIAKAELGATARWRDLGKWNGIDDPQQLKIGQKLRLSPPGDAKAQAQSATAAPTGAKAPVVAGERTHKVAKGDTLSRIAALYLGDASRWREIQRLNGIADAANLTEGATLQLPAR